MNTSETRLCSGCQQFFGTEATNFMCSQCFKQTTKPKEMKNEDSIDLAKKQIAHNVGNDQVISNRADTFSADVQMEPEEKPVVEEAKTKVEEQPKPKVSSFSALRLIHFTPGSSPANANIYL